MYLSSPCPECESRGSSQAATRRYAKIFSAVFASFLIVKLTPIVREILAMRREFVD